MLKKDKTQKQGKTPENGGFEGQVLSALEAITHKLQEHDEQIAEFGTDKGRGQAVLQLVNFLYDPDDTHLPGLTRLPLRAVKPFAIAATLDAITDPDVMSGKKTLQQVFRTNYFFLMRSVGAEAFKQGIGLAGEQQASEAEQQGAEFRLGEQ